MKDKVEFFDKYWDNLAKKTLVIMKKGKRIKEVR